MEQGIRCLQVHISYLEIYNETGYDLLNPDREVQMLEDLPKVAIMEDEDSNIHMRNLSIHRASNEEEALNLVTATPVLDLHHLQPWNFILRCLLSQAVWQSN